MNDIKKEFTAEEVTKVLKFIKDEFSFFEKNTINLTNKAAAVRARKSSTTLAKLFKEFRAISIK